MGLHAGPVFAFRVRPTRNHTSPVVIRPSRSRRAAHGKSNLSGPPVAATTLAHAILASMVQLIGFVAGTLTALAFLPQVVQTCRTRSCGDLSIGMLLTQSGGVALWIVYGLKLGSLPVILANSVTLVLVLVLLGFKLTRRPDCATA
jgi:MtN3 and saliva related transmembrane protein